MIIFLYGQDSFRGRLKLNELKDKYRREVDKLGSGLAAVDGAKATLAEIASAAGPSSLLSKKRLIVIENIFLNKDQEIFVKLAEYFKSRKRNDNIIIFWQAGLKVKKIKNTVLPVLANPDGQAKPLNKKLTALFKFLAAQKYAYSFNSLNNSQAASWVKKETARRGGKINTRAAELLVGLVGADGWQMDNELAKLLSYKTASQLTASGPEIEIEDVKNLVRGNFSENIFALTDALSVKNKALAVRLLDEQIEAGLSDGYLLNMFVRQFRILLQIKQALLTGLSQRQIAGQLKLHPFVAQKGVEQARHFTLPILKNILSRLIKIDYEVKSGQSDYLTGLNMLLAGL